MSMQCSIKYCSQFLYQILCCVTISHLCNFVSGNFPKFRFGLLSCRRQQLASALAGTGESRRPRTGARTDLRSYRVGKIHLGITALGKNFGKVPDIQFILSLAVYLKHNLSHSTNFQHSVLKMGPKPDMELLFSVIAIEDEYTWFPLFCNQSIQHFPPLPLH